jgi:hypothetical protein
MIYWLIISFENKKPLKLIGYKQKPNAYKHSRRQSLTYSENADGSSLFPSFLCRFGWLN